MINRIGMPSLDPRKHQKHFPGSRAFVTLSTSVIMA